MHQLLSRAVFVPVLILASCSSVGVTPIKPGPAKPKDHPIDIYTSEAEVRRPFEVCCLIDSTTSGSFLNRNTAAAAIENAKKAARKYGADALIVMAAEKEGASFNSMGAGKATLKAIRYTK